WTPRSQCVIVLARFPVRPKVCGGALVFPRLAALVVAVLLLSLPAAPGSAVAARSGPPLQRPVPGAVVQAFAPPSNRGIDLAATAGTVVVAPAAGLVAF